jgi:hypothetical protein
MKITAAIVLWKGKRERERERENDNVLLIWPEAMTSRVEPA